MASDQIVSVSLIWQLRHFGKGAEVFAEPRIVTKATLLKLQFGQENPPHFEVCQHTVKPRLHSKVDRNQRIIFYVQLVD